MQSLVEAFQPNTIGGLMCGSMLSVNRQGSFCDCDFNQMLDRSIATADTVWAAQRAVDPLAREV